MAKFTKAERQEIIRSFAIRHNGQYDAYLFVEEVRRVGPEHPAYAWFQWDEAKAAFEYQLWQAREFSSGLCVSWSIEEIGRDKTITVREIEAPFLLSPARGSKGGGYYIVDLDNPEHMRELARQASVDLAGWLRRYEAALVAAGGSVVAVSKQIKVLEAAAVSVESITEAA